MYIRIGDECIASQSPIFLYINISAALMGLYSIIGGFIYVRFFPGCVQQDEEVR